MPLSPDLLEPISGENPGGANLRYEPVYDKIRRAREEEDEIPQGEWKRERKVADHGLVIKLATEVLTKQSKDLQIAAWLTEALLKRDGFGGLRDGLELMRAYLDNFWDTLHPELEDGDPELRAAPLEWVGGGYLDTAIRLVPLNEAGHGFADYKQSRRVGYEEDAKGDDAKATARAKAVQEGKLTPEEFDEGFAATPKAWYKELVADIDGCAEAVQALDALCQVKFEADPPGFLKLREAIQEVRQVAGQLLKRKLEAEPDPPEAVAADAAAEAETAAGAGSAPADAESGVAAAGAGAVGAVPAASPAAAAPASANDAAALVAAAARYLRSQNAGDPSPYLLIRGLRWGELRSGEGAIDPKLLVAPTTETRTRLKTLLLDGEWSALLETAEETMATPAGRGWLDLQRHVLTACDELGHEAVGVAVRGALRTLLQDLPELADMTLMDDSPAANAETRAWLEKEKLAGTAAAAEGDGGAPVFRDEGVPRRAPLGRAMERLRAGQPEKAVEILMKEAAQEKSARARFLRRVQAARIMVDAGLEPVAMPMLKEMLEQIERHNLEEWESGETIAESLGLLYRCVDKLEDDPTTKQSLYVRVCRLDPIQAMRYVQSRAQPQPQADEQPGA